MLVISFKSCAYSFIFSLYLSALYPPYYLNNTYFIYFNLYLSVIGFTYANNNGINNYFVYIIQILPVCLTWRIFTLLRLLRLPLSSLPLQPSTTWLSTMMCYTLLCGRSLKAAHHKQGWKTSMESAGKSNNSYHEQISIFVMAVPWSKSRKEGRKCFI